MSTYKFKTTMSCSNCVSKVEKILNGEKDILKWEVDLVSPDKILTVETEKLDPNQIPALLLKAGFKATQI